MIEGDWCVAVFKCKSVDARKVLIGLYQFVKDVEGVRSLHFLAKDRLRDEVVFSFRVLTDPKFMQSVKSKIRYKLGTLMLDKQFALDPDADDSLGKYVAWSPAEEISRGGPKKFSDFCGFLSRMSKLALQMARKKYFDSDERVKMACAAAEMFACTEYGILSAEHWEIGYYDRIGDRYCARMKRTFDRSSASVDRELDR